MREGWLLAGICMAALGQASPAAARFLETDAATIDGDDHIQTEHYNDVASYRSPVSWDEVWDAHANGFRANAGSLSVNRFDYREDLKLLASDPEVPVSLSVTHTRREDTAEQRLERELRVTWTPFGPWRLAWLGDSGTYKEYGDMGAAAAYEWEPGRRLEIYYWDPDLYYASKKSDEADFVRTRTNTRGLKGRWRWGEGWRAAFDASTDHPLVWDRRSRGYRYEYGRSGGSWELMQRVPAGIGGYARGFHELKFEAKTWRDEATLANYRKDMERRYHRVELGALQLDGDHERMAALELIARDTRYGFQDYTGLGDAPYVEGSSPPSLTRREAGLYVTDHHGIGSPAGRHFMQWGLFANRVSLAEERREPWYEVKVQTAYDGRIGKRGGIFLNATWDVDQLTSDFPYEERPFRPWGGGDLQVYVVF